MKEIQDPQKLLELVLIECKRLREENAHLKKILGMKTSENKTIDSLQPQLSSSETLDLVQNNSSSESKIQLFRSLFQSREDVYALRWENKKSGKSGYSPACIHDWNCPLCHGDRIKRLKCENRKFLSLTDSVIGDHLMGKQVVGIYPLKID